MSSPQIQEPVDGQLADKAAAQLNVTTAPSPSNGLANGHGHVHNAHLEKPGLLSSNNHLR